QYAPPPQQQYAPPPQQQYAPPPQQQYAPPPPPQQQYYSAPQQFSPPAGGGGGMGGGFDASAVEIQDGSRAIELAAMFEDAVIDVRHFSNPMAGEVTGGTKGMLAGGAIALTIAFI